MGEYFHLGGGGSGTTVCVGGLHASSSHVVAVIHSFHHAMPHRRGENQLGSSSHLSGFVTLSHLADFITPVLMYIMLWALGPLGPITLLVQHTYTCTALYLYRTLMPPI